MIHETGTQKTHFQIIVCLFATEESMRGLKLEKCKISQGLIHYEHTSAMC